MKLVVDRIPLYYIITYENVFIVEFIYKLYRCQILLDNTNKLNVTKNSTTCMGIKISKQI